jgi:hypothetical protein
MRRFCCLEVRPADNFKPILKYILTYLIPYAIMNNQMRKAMKTYEVVYIFRVQAESQENAEFFASELIAPDDLVTEGSEEQGVFDWYCSGSEEV